MSVFVMMTIFTIVSSLITIILVQFSHTEANIDTYNGKELTNETFLDNPNDEDLVAAFSNGMTLSSYINPKKTDFTVTEGLWTVDKLAQFYPNIIEKMESENSKKTYLVKKSIVIDKDAELNILDTKLLLKSLSNKDNVPVVIITYGTTNVINSTIVSWDPQRNTPDFNPYHPRSFLVAKDGGKLNIFGSTILYLGFSQGGIHTLFSSLAALDYYNTTGFSIANSILAHNLYAFYSDESSKFNIIGNEVYGNVGYGLDPHTGSSDFIIDSNHLFTNGGQGIICSFKCINGTISNNNVEYNVEGIGLHWLTNSSIIKNNVVKYNKGYGLYVKTNSTNNILVNNTILGNGRGIGLLGNSNYNIVKSNILVGNILEKDQIHQDNDSRSNFFSDNRYEIN